MKSITFVAALAAAVTAALGLTINTPSSVVECEPTQFTWSGGTAPYYLSLLPAGQTTATPIMTFPTQNGNSYTWPTNLGSGTSFTVSLKDSTGSVAYSDIVTVQAGSDSSCLNSSNSASGTGAGSSGAAASTGGSSPASTAAAGTTAAGTTAAGASASSKSAPSATSSGSTATQSSSAGRLGVSSAFGVAGVMGLVGAALF